MKHTQFLIFEANRECNLGRAHAKCPNLHPERCKHCDTTRPLPDERILSAVAEAYGTMGFHGYVGFHYYNEPLLARARVLPLCRKIKRDVPTARFVLWTNGTQIPQEDDPEFAQLAIFDRAWVTRYDSADYSRIKRVIPSATLVRWQLDNRASAPKTHDDLGPCARPFSEIVFDFHGNCHLCCIDWRGEVRLGNLHDESLPEIVSRFVAVRESISRGRMTSAAPSTCKRCVGRHAHVSALVPEIAAEAKAWLRAPAPEPVPHAQATARVRPDGPIGVVFVSYRIPEERLRAHFAWNDALYRARGARVFVVVDRRYDGLPDYARQLVYDDPMPVFNLARTKNRGIRHAIESGCGIVVATDVDVVPSEAAWEAMAATRPGRGIVPIYRMAASYDRRATEYVLAPNATGTVALHAEDWRRAHYHEKCVGYGCDDGILLAAMKRVGIPIERAPGAELWHIAHAEGTPQKEFDKTNPRVDHWGRDAGFNPENFSGNRKLHADPVYADPRWGLRDGASEVCYVLVHYRMPERRLVECLAWNRDVWEETGARVIVVSDRDAYAAQDAFPEWVRVAKYPRELERFNLSATSNYGIRLAGRGVVAKTDPDVFWPAEAARRVVAVTEGLGYCPRYRMADAATEEAFRRAQLWDASKGTLALTASHWEAIHGYDERMIGYGIEDGDAFHRAGVGCRPERDVERGVGVGGEVFHIAHTATPQTSGNTRRDCWGRDDGFNPKGHLANMKARRTAWTNPAWGTASA